MNKDDYLSQRVDDQINWYDKKSQGAQRKFKSLRSFEIIAAASIPIIAGFGKDYENIPVELIVGVLGALIAIVAAIVSLNRYQENWIEYRTTCETMKHEKYLFLTKVAPYDNEKAFALFVQKIEKLVSKENSQWSQNALANNQNTDFSPQEKH